MSGAKKLQEYANKRDFSITPEPSEQEKINQETLPRPIYLIQKHQASHLHYDFRLEIDGVLKSWSVPKGPSIDIGKKRLAVETEDHPIEYAKFEGVIPPYNYGGGEVIIWDRGSWQCDGDASEQYRKGSISFEIKGERLKGHWRLIKMKDPSNRNWLLIKSHDKEKLKLIEPDPSGDETSVVSGKTLNDLKR